MVEANSDNSRKPRIQSGHTQGLPVEDNARPQAQQYRQNTGRHRQG